MLRVQLNTVSMTGGGNGAHVWQYKYSTSAFRSNTSHYSFFIVPFSHYLSTMPGYKVSINYFPHFFSPSFVLMFNRLGHSTHLKSDQIVVNPSIAVLSDIRKTAVWITPSRGPSTSLPSPFPHNQHHITSCWRVCWTPN